MQVGGAQKRHPKLADIAQPGSLHDRLDLIVVDVKPWMLDRNFGQKVEHEQRNVRRALSQRWQNHRRCSETKEQIFAKVAGAGARSASRRSATMRFTSSSSCSRCSVLREISAMRSRSLPPWTRC